jgi:hypothetical protein
MRRAAIAGFVIVAAVGATSLVAYPASVSPEKAERLAKRFVLEKMRLADGGILTNGKVRRLLLFPMFDPADLAASGVLSETAGLAMQYAVLADDQALFESQFEYVKRKLTGPYGLFYWKVSQDAEMAAASSASIDDLRIVGACLTAAEKWKRPAYAAFATDIADNLAKYAVVGGALRDFLNWRDYGDPVKADTLQLSYIESSVLQALAKRDASWQPVLQRTGELLLRGQRPSGLFFEQYNFTAGRYEGERQNMINQLYCALFALELEKSGRPFAVWLRKRFAADGALYAQYDSAAGEPTETFESTSVYALASRYAYLAGDEALGDELIKKLLGFQNLNPFSSMYGAFADDEVYSFDNFEALIALRVHNERRKS